MAVCDYRNGRVTRFTPGGQLQVERPGQQLDTREKQTFELDSAVLVLSGIDEARSPGGTRPWGVVRDSLDVPFVVRFAVHQDGA